MARVLAFLQLGSSELGSLPGFKGCLQTHSCLQRYAEATYMPQPIYPDACPHVYTHSTQRLRQQHAQAKRRSRIGAAACSNNR